MASHLPDELKKAKDFHSHLGPYLVVGLKMGRSVVHRLGDEPFSMTIEVFTGQHPPMSCVVDGLQLATPCTVGNGWLKIINLGRFALSFFEKFTGSGVRVYVDNKKLDDWPEVKTFFFKLKPKKEQDFAVLMDEVHRAHTSIFSVQKVLLDLDFIRSHRRGGFAVCPLCGEGYPVNDGKLCLGCQGDAPYVSMEIPDS